VLLEPPGRRPHPTRKRAAVAKRTWSLLAGQHAPSFDQPSTAQPRGGRLPSDSASRVSTGTTKARPTRSTARQGKRRTWTKRGPTEERESPAAPTVKDQILEACGMARSGRARGRRGRARGPRTPGDQDGPAEAARRAGGALPAPKFVPDRTWRLRGDRVQGRSAR